MKQNGSAMAKKSGSKSKTFSMSNPNELSSHKKEQNGKFPSSYINIVYSDDIKTS